MVRPFFWLFTALLGFFLAGTGCRKQASVKSQVTDLEKAFPTAAVQTPAPEQQQPAAQPEAPNAVVGQALAAARANDYAGAVIALQSAKDRPGLTVEQFRAIEAAKSAMVNDLQNRADRGDARAKADLAAIERKRSQ